MKGNTRKALIIGISLILCITAILLILHFCSSAVRKTITEEYLVHLDSAFSDVYEQPDCMEYGLSDIQYEIESCEATHSVSGKWYVITLQIYCKSDMALDKTEKSLLSYEVLDQVPEEFRTSGGHKVTTRNMDSSSAYASAKMVYIYVNNELINAPKALRPLSGNSKDVICPTCGTGWRAGSVAAKYVAKNGVCSVCT